MYAVLTPKHEDRTHGLGTFFAVNIRLFLGSSVKHEWSFFLFWALNPRSQGMVPTGRRTNFAWVTILITTSTRAPQFILGNANFDCQKKRLTSQNMRFRSGKMRKKHTFMRQAHRLVNTEFDWEVKMGIKKSVCKWSCPLTRVSVSGELTVL